MIYTKLSNKFKYRNFFSICIFSIVILGALYFTSFISSYTHTEIAYAETVEDLQNKIDERNRNIEQLTKEIKAYEELTDKTTAEAISLKKVIKDLEDTEKFMSLDIKRIRGRIDVANLDIKKLDINIDKSLAKIEKLHEGIASSIKDIDRSDSISFIENILGQQNITDFFSEVENQLSFTRAIQGKLTEIKQEKESLEVNKGTQEGKKKELVKMQADLAGKKKVVDYAKSEQNKALTETKNQEKTFQKILKDKVAAKEAFAKEIFEFESQIKYTLNPSSIPKAGSVFSWPVDNVIITQRFGKTVAAKRLYVSGSHNGVDFGVRTGTPVKAVLGGTVMGTGDTDLTCKRASFGRWVFIKHDNGLATIYAHLSVISATEGQRVDTGDVIGYSGNTGYSTGPHLHISAYASDAVSVQNRPSASCGGRVYRMPIAPIEAYLDPILYFPPYNR